MMPLDCSQVAEHLDLHAVGECDQSTAEAVSRHLDSCAECRHRLANSTLLAERLDWHFQEDAAIERLLGTLAREARPISRPWMARPAVRRAFALAASLLLVVGLGIVLPQPMSDQPPSGVVAWLEPAERHVPGPPLSKMAVGEMVERSLPLSRDSAVQLPRVDLRLHLANPERQTIHLHPDDPQTSLHLELSGPSVKRQWPGPGALAPVLEPSRRTLPPGQVAELPVPWLIEGTRKMPRYLFWTEPGKYQLTIRYTVPVSRTPQGPRQLRSFTSEPLTLSVGRP